MPTVGQLCKRIVAIARRGETLRDAAARMRDQHTGTVVVVDEQEGKRLPVGILTDRDIVVVVLARTDRHIGSVHVGEVMSRQLIHGIGERRAHAGLDAHAGLRRTAVARRRRQRRAGRHPQRR
jgi:CBS domain-containing protein